MIVEPFVGEVFDREARDAYYGSMDEIAMVDDRFRELALPNAWLEKICGGMMWAEGPVYFAGLDLLLWSDIPANRMMRLTGSSVTVFRSPSNYSNGNTRDRQGRLVTCEHGTRRVTRTEIDGAITVLADSYRGRRLNSPNDVVVKSDGTIWFTDPDYGILTDYEGHRGEREQDGCHVYRIDPAKGTVEIAADDLARPNGLCFSPDESLLYVSDTSASHDRHGNHHIRAFRVDDSARLHGSRVFAEVEPGLPDGFRVDERGNIWTSCGEGVHCYSPDAELLGKLLVPEVVSNITFGGRRRNRLFITASTSLYSLYVAVRGAR